MSLLLYLCRECRHQAASHEGGDSGYSGCACCRGRGDIAADQPDHGSGREAQPRPLSG